MEIKNKKILITGGAGFIGFHLAKKLSKNLGAPVLFSGQLYRAVAYEVIVQKIATTNIKKIIKIGSLFGILALIIYL